MTLTEENWTDPVARVKQLPGFMARRAMSYIEVTERLASSELPSGRHTRALVDSGPSTVACRAAPVPEGWTLEDVQHELILVKEYPISADAESLLR